MTGSSKVNGSKYVIWHLKNRCLHICSFHSQNASTLHNTLHDDWLKIRERLKIRELENAWQGFSYIVKLLVIFSDRRLLLLSHSEMDGSSCFNLIQASSVLNNQLTVASVPFLSSTKASTSITKVSSSGMYFF